MTNYDRWKLATPDYLENEDDSCVYDPVADGSDELEVRANLQPRQEDAQ